MMFFKFKYIVISALLVAMLCGCSDGKADIVESDTTVPTTVVATQEEVATTVKSETVAQTEIPTKEIEPTQAPTKALEPTQTPTKAPVRVPAEPKTEAPTESVGVSYEGYAEILRKNVAKKFDLIYIDNDDVAELAIYNGHGAHLDQVSLYTIYNGRVAYLGKVGMYGTMTYSMGSNRIFGCTAMNPSEELEAKYTYMIKDGKLVTAPDHKGYATITISIYDNGFENNETNITRMLNGELV